MSTQDNKKLGLGNFSKQEKPIEIASKQSITSAPIKVPQKQTQTIIKKDNKK